MEFRFASHDTGQVKLDFAAIGDPRRPLILCLHGFPEYWAGWREVMKELANDIHLIAPDQRGYNRSTKPDEVAAYRTSRMVADTLSLADRYSPDRPFILAGHDWGASVAYAFAFRYPERISHLIIANGVHPVCFQRAILDDPEQRAASQYVNLLRSDRAEALLSEDDYRRLFGMICGFSKFDFMSDEARAGYLDAWSQPGALTGMLNWYRAAPILVPPPGEPAEMPDKTRTGSFDVAVPHLVLWGEADEALQPSCLHGLQDFASDLTIERFPDAGHWILHEKPVEVALAMKRFLAGGDRR